MVREKVGPGWKLALRGQGKRSTLTFHFFWRATMPKANLSRMNVEALMDLRKRVDETLLQHRGEIQKQLERMDRAIAVVGDRRVVRSGGSVLKGRKIKPKYRGP